MKSLWFKLVFKLISVSNQKDQNNILCCCCYYVLLLFSDRGVWWLALHQVTFVVDVSDVVSPSSVVVAAQFVPDLSSVCCATASGEVVVFNVETLEARLRAHFLPFRHGAI